MIKLKHTWAGGLKDVDACGTIESPIPDSPIAADKRSCAFILNSLNLLI